MKLLTSLGFCLLNWKWPWDHMLHRVVRRWGNTICKRLCLGASHLRHLAVDCSLTQSHHWAPELQSRLVTGSELDEAVNEKQWRLSTLVSLGCLIRFLCPHTSYLSQLQPVKCTSWMTRIFHRVTTSLGPLIATILCDSYPPHLLLPAFQQKTTGKRNTKLSKRVEHAEPGTSDSDFAPSHRPAWTRV